MNTEKRWPSGNAGCNPALPDEAEVTACFARDVFHDARTFFLIVFLAILP